MNTWPGGRRRPMLQSEHNEWNANSYPGTRQLCERCGAPTGRCEDDSLYQDELIVCEECWSENMEDVP